MKIGFTGTRNKVTELQKSAFTVIVCDFKNQWSSRAMDRARNDEWEVEYLEFHHGDCVGADSTASMLWRQCVGSDTLGVHLVAHPCNISSMIAHTFADEYRELLPPLVRNKNIVNETDVLVAMPEGHEMMRSGTWSTVRYARKMDKPRVIVWPDGRIVWEKEVGR